MTYIALVLVCIAIALETARRWPWLSLAVVGIGTTTLSWQWLHTRTYEPFVYLKFYSVVVGVLLVEALRLSRLGQKPGVVRITGAILLLNIAEAVIKDLGFGTLPHVLNALSGIAVAAGLFYFGDLGLRHDGPRVDLVWRAMTLPWIVAYTVWNWVFVYLNFPTNAGIHLGVLAAPLLCTASDPERWGQARAHSLGLYLTFRFLGDPWLPSDFFASERWSSPTGALVGGVVSLSLALAVLTKQVADRRLTTPASR